MYLNSNMDEYFCYTTFQTGLFDANPAMTFNTYYDLVELAKAKMFL